MRFGKLLTVTSALTLASTLAFGGIAVAEAPAKGKPLSAKQFRKTANNICDQAYLLLHELQGQYFSDLGPDETPSLDTLAAYAEDSEPIVQQQIDSIAKLNPPKSLKKKVKKLIQAAQADLDAFLDDPSIALEADPFADTLELSRALDLPACAGE